MMIPCLLTNTTANLHAIDFASGPVKSLYLTKLEAAHSKLVSLGKRTGSPLHRADTKINVSEKEVVATNKASL